MAEEFEKPQYSEQEQIRRAKLAKYCEEGRDPYTITRFDRTHTSAEVLSNFDALEKALKSWKARPSGLRAA